MPIVRTRPLVLAAAVAAAFAAAVCPPPAGASHPRGGVTLFAAGDFRGASETFYGDVPSLRGSAVGNDHASSVRLAPGCVATLYEHHEYRGRSTLVNHDIADLRRTAVGNDAVSSLRLHCDFGPGTDDVWRNGRGVALYAAGGFEGRREVFDRDDANLSNNRIGNDHASSVRVAPGCRAILYAGGDFQGRAVEIDRDVRNLGATSVGNDTVSSLRVDCDRNGDPWRDRDDRRHGRRDDDRGAWGSPWGSGHGGHDDGHDGHGGYDGYDDRNYHGEDCGYDDHAGVTVYRGGGFTDGHESFYGDVPNLSHTAVGNDHASSVRVAPGCRVILYRHSDYRGETTILTHDEPDLRRTRVGNDQVSSIEVDCRRW
ncbi:MAG: hypothetical protein GY719_14525 [bacterium]|nr:hypothetical protein [bacterium]